METYRVPAHCDLIIEIGKFEEREKGNKASSKCTDFSMEFSKSFHLSDD